MPSLNGFNANDVKPAASFDPLPAGKYLAVITESATKPTKAGDGEYLQFTFQVLEGEHKGRLVWTRLNLKNPSSQAVEIAKGELSALCRAVGVMTPKDSIELHNLPLVVKVACKKRHDTGEMTNVIKGYERKGSPQAPPRPAPGGAGAPPWARGGQ